MSSTRPTESPNGAGHAPGSGRRHIDCEDHIREQDFSEPPMAHEGLWGISGPLPRGPVPRQFGTTSVHGPVSPAEPEDRIPTPSEMKDSVREWLSEVFGVAVADQSKWDQVSLVKHGSYWSVQALNHRGQSLAREGPTARAAAEKLSSLPQAELRHFGLRFVPTFGQEMQNDNPSLQSPGVHHAFGSRAETPGSPGGQEPGISSVRKDPDELGRRYIATGKDNFEGLCQAQTEASHGGRRIIAQKSNFEHGALMASEEASRRQSFSRKSGYALAGSTKPLW
eukprot:TRINITY_DN47209_c0_g1_i1.p1 TRINITY_DN47209_c0_g1~~TRINITY_DN47209_c0_g1_i1.p1  ORF type:complete len:289 (-),score=44.16 TRINITY_DN47209_c0_g1_i1:189-1031(-)